MPAIPAIIQDPAVEVVDGLDKLYELCLAEHAAILRRRPNASHTGQQRRQDYDWEMQVAEFTGHLRDYRQMYRERAR